MVYGVFKVFSQNRVQQRLVKQIIVFQHRLSNRSLISPFLVEAFKIYAQDRVLRHPLKLILRMTRFKGFFALFPKTKKSTTPPPHSGWELPPHSSPWTPSAYDVPTALEEEEEVVVSEEELDDDVEFVEFDGCWWGCEWVPARQQCCWWLAAADGSQAGHTMWRQWARVIGFAGAWFDSDTWSASAPGCLCRVVLPFYAEVVSVLQPGVLVCVSR